MRIPLACVLVAALAQNVAADARIKNLIRGFKREAGSCQKMARGVRVVIERGKPFAGSDTELATDLAELAKAQETVQGHCDELESTLELLEADPGATFKALSKQIDEHDKRIRSSRAASRQAIADAEPLISRSVLRINKLTAEADAAAHLSTREQKAAAAKTSAPEPDPPAATKVATAATVPVAKPPETKPLKFPSGRTVELPPPAEAWTLSGATDVDIADYAFAGAKATLLVRRHAGSLTCEHIRASVSLIGGRSPAQKVDAGADLVAVKPAWTAAWTEGSSQVRVVCVQGKGAVVVGRTDVSMAANAPFGTALARMIAANLRR